MAHIDLRLEGKGAFRDIPKDKLFDAGSAQIRIAGVSRGLVVRHPIVAIGLMLPRDKGCVYGQTSLEAFLNAADELKKQFGDPRIRIGS